MATRACVCEGGTSKLFSRAAAPDGPREAVARGKCILSQLGPAAGGLSGLRGGRRSPRRRPLRDVEWHGGG
eukprot:15445317-Alexandrium_andersonii.AAC.1